MSIKDTGRAYIYEADDGAPAPDGLRWGVCGQQGSKYSIRTGPSCGSDRGRRPRLVWGQHASGAFCTPSSTTSRWRLSVWPWALSS